MIDAPLELARDFQWNSADIEVSRRDSSMPLEVQAESMRRVGGTERMIAFRPVLVAKLSDAEITRFVNDACHWRNGAMFSAPRVTIFNGQTFVVDQSTHRPFVTGRRPPVTTNQSGSVQLDSVREGWSIRITGQAVSSNKLSPEVLARQSRRGGVSGAVDVTCVVNESQVRGVQLAELPQPSTSATSSIIIQVPQVDRLSVQAKVQLLTDESLLFALPATFTSLNAEPKPPARFYLITPRLIADK